MAGYGYIRNPPKYSCSVCNKLFRRRKQKDDHILFNRCKGLKKLQRVKDNNKHIEHFIVEPELISLKPEIEHTEPHPLSTKYYGAPYDYHYPGLLTGNRHLRAGLPFANDPLRRTIVRPILPKAMPSLWVLPNGKTAPIPTLSKHKYGLQAI